MTSDTPASPGWQQHERLGSYVAHEIGFTDGGADYWKCRAAVVRAIEESLGIASPATPEQVEAVAHDAYALGPCPFCSGEFPPTVTRTREGDVVICISCSALGPTRRSITDAIDAWNTRAMPAASPVRVAEGFQEAAEIGYRICAESRHVSLGDKIRAALLEASPPSPTPPAREDGVWQPIDSAPRDGTWILGYNWKGSTYHIHTMFWDAGFESQGYDEVSDKLIYRAAWNALHVGSFGYEEYAEEHPTHWMPIPYAPHPTATTPASPQSERGA